MEFIDRTIEARQARLRQSALCQYILDHEVAPYERLSFVPAMLFFTMGFRDILDALRDPGDHSELQQIVHQHCDEDSFHWQWYLEDLAVIDHGRRVLHLPAAQAFTDVWSPTNQATREVIYQAIHLAKTYSTPFYRLVIIEALEATFACFNEPVFKLVATLGMADQLHYFGKVHEHAEASHAKDQEPAELSYAATEEELGTADMLVHAMFDVFEEMFDCWHAARSGEMPEPVAA